MCQVLGWEIFIDGEIIRPWMFSLEDIKLYIRGQGRDFESGKSDFYLERLQSGSEFRVMRNKVKTEWEEMAMLCRWVGPSQEQCLEHNISTGMSPLSCPAEARRMPVTW